MYQISKKYRFYSAHRNEALNSKCRNIHGHTYIAFIDLSFPAEPTQSGVCLLFSEIDSLLEPFFANLDHGFLIHKHDPLLSYLQKYAEEHDDPIKLIILDFPTSVENMCKHILTEVTKFDLPIVSVRIRETLSSEVRLTV